MAHSAYVVTAVQEGILLLQAGYVPKGGYQIGTWMNPGGRLDNTDQNVLSGAIREWEEEVGTRFSGPTDLLKLLGVFLQRDGTICTVFFAELLQLDFEERVVATESGPEILSRRVFSLEEIKTLHQENKIFRAQFCFIAWYSQIKNGSLSNPIFDRIMPDQEPVLII